MPPWVNIPNSLTVLRLLLVPLVIRDIIDGNHLRALAVFAIAALTDLLDGASARRFRSTTPAGAYLDPIADKCLLSGAFLALAAAGLVPRWLVFVIFGRDIYILCAVGLLLWSTSLRRFPPSVWGKLSTFVQIVTAVVCMARNALPVPVLETLSSAMLWPCTAFTLWSGVHYTWKGVQLARAH